MQSNPILPHNPSKPHVFPFIHHKKISKREEPKYPKINSKTIEELFNKTNCNMISYVGEITIKKIK